MSEKIGDFYEQDGDKTAELYFKKLVLWREPKKDADYTFLDKNNVEAIVNLRSAIFENFDHDLLLASYRAAKHGFLFIVGVCIPFFPPTEEVCDLVFSRVQISSGRTLVHCRDSVDRTGVFLLHYLVMKGVPFEKAWQVVKDRGMHKRFFWWKWILKRRYKDFSAA